MIIPTAHTTGLKIVGIVLVLIGAFAAGAVVNGWRLDGKHRDELAVKQGEIDMLQGSLREQNTAVAALGDATIAADNQRKLAEKFAADAIKRLGQQGQGVADTQAVNCDGVLSEAWERWK